jgi:hypothetical protein
VNDAQGFSFEFMFEDGSPFSCRRGKIRLTNVGAKTDLPWTVRFRPKLRGSGPLLRVMVDRMLRNALDRRMKPLIERT